MPKIQYECPEWLARWHRKCEDDDALKLDKLPPTQQTTMATIMTANEILEDYEKQGFQLTLRQLYYQFVARDLIPNTEKSYKRLGNIISNGRLWGFIDWNRLVDRGRNFMRFQHWDDPAHRIRSARASYMLDRWSNSENRIEVWVEKQALEDIIAHAADPFDVGYIACKGYMSQSEMWQAAQRILAHERDGQTVTILHLGDHDPSGIDMSRDIQDRLRLFRCDAEVKRIALNMDQIRQYNPPPNPAKVTDSRADSYIAEFGYESWELDALPPDVLTNLIQGEIRELLDNEYHEREEEEDRGRELLSECSDRWDEVVELLQE